MARSQKRTRPAAFSLRDLYEAYPDSDLLPLDPENLTLETVEFEERRCGLGDTLFLFLARELCAPADVCDLDIQLSRVESAIGELESIRRALQQRRESVSC